MRKFSVVTLQHRPIMMNEAASVTEACDQMRAHRAGSVLVTGDTGRLVGIFTGRDAVCRVPDQTAFDALLIMANGGFRHVPLIRNGGIVGLVSRGDFRGLELNPDDEECDLWEHLH